MRQFDKQQKHRVDEPDNVMRQICELDEDSELDDIDEIIESDEQNNEGWVDEMEQLTQDQQDNIIEGIQPICLILMKASVYIYWPGEVVIYMNQPQLRKLAFKIINSTTKLLPLWHMLLLQFTALCIM